MTQIIPTVNCIDLACVSHRFLELVKFLPKNGWAHLDIADARFTYNKTWSNPEELKKLFEAHPEFCFNIEVHLMAEEPEKHILGWLAAGAKRVIVHAEAILDQQFREPKMKPEAVVGEIFKQCGKFKAEVMLSTNPETKLDDIRELLESFNAFQVLAVTPGPSGQKFLPVALEKIQFLRQQFPNAKIEVDGGVNLETAKQAKEAGADILAVGSCIFDSSDPKNKYEELSKI